MNAIDKYMDKLPDELVEEMGSLRKISNIIQLACRYSPDHERGGLYERRLSDTQTVFGVTVELAQALDECFFRDLYFDRPERGTVLDVMGGGNYLIILIGHVGVGKTVLILKLARDISASGDAKVVLFNFRTEVSRFTAGAGKDFRQQMKEWVFSRVYAETLTDELLSGWRQYKILYDKQYEGLRQQIEDFAGFRLTTPDRVDQALQFAPVKEFLLHYDSKPETESLLAYLLDNNVHLVLLFDNVDRRSLSDQTEVLSLCNDIVDEFGIPILLTIRTPNIRRMMREIRKREGDESPDARVFWTEDLEAGPLGKRRPIKVYHMHPSSVRGILEKRFDFLRSRGMFGEYERLRKELLEKYNLTLDEFEMRFWKVFEDITKEFLERGMYAYSNYNIREMLLQYVNFTSTVMLNPEQDYRWEKLLLSSTEVDVTRLKTYLFKWQICNGNIVPGRSEGLVNIFENPEHTLGLLDWRIMLYLFNNIPAQPQQKLKFADAAEDFRRIGINSDLLAKRLLDLGRGKGVHEVGLIWLDGDQVEDINDETILELEPAGIYFVDSLAVTREYAFWNAITADLSVDVVGRGFDLNTTYDDKFKLEVVFSLIDKMLIPGLKSDLEQFVDRMEQPSSWEGSKVEYFKRKFTKEGRYYVDHLITSVKGTIDYSYLDKNDKGRFHRRYDTLKHTLKQALSSTR